MLRRVGMKQYDQMSWPEAEAAATGLAILPLGATEQHGPHLPLTVDTVLAKGVATALARRIDAVLLPALPYGEAWSSEAFPGTISLSPETLQAAISDIARGVRRIGHPGLITLNGHFGNRLPAEKAAAELSEAGFPMLCLDYPGLEELAERICETPAAGDNFYHADEVETSMMLALAAERVALEQAVAEYPEFPKDFGTRPMQLRDFNTTGVFGDPRPSTAEKGRALIDGIVDNCLPLIDAFCSKYKIGMDAWQH